MRTPIATQSASGRSKPLTIERLVNMYAEMAPAGAKSPVVVHGCPGLTRFADIDTRRTRGLYRTPADGRLYAVVRNTPYFVDSDGNPTALGTIDGAGRVGMSDNGQQLCIVTGPSGYTYSVSEGLQQITDPGFPGAETVTFLDGYFIFNNSTPGQRGQFFISNLLDGQMYDAADFSTAESYPDNLIRVFADHSQLLLFGTETIEIWFNAGLADFPFTRAQGSVIEQGLGARWSVAKVDETVIWLDNEGMVRRLEGNTPVRISTHAIEYDISRGDWENASAWSYVEEGHQFYVLTVPAADLSTQTAGTYVFDAATQLWHDRKSYRKDYCRSGFYARAYGKHITADIDIGRLYEQSLDVYEEDGEHLIAEMQFPQVQNDGNRFIVHRLQLDMEVGVEPLRIQAPPTYFFDPDSWIARSNNFVSFCQAVAFGEDTFVGVGNDGVIQYSIDSGTTWNNTLNVFGTSVIFDVAYGDGLFMAVGQLFKTAISPDGINWTLQSQGSGNNLSVVYGNGFWLSASGFGIRTSVDNGVSWQSTNIIQICNDIEFDGSSMYIAVSSSGIIFTSADGFTWSQVDISSIFGDVNLTMVKYLNGMWFIGSNNGQLAISTNGINFTLVAIPFSGAVSLMGAAYGFGTYYICGNSASNNLAYSTDSVNWNLVAMTVFSASTEGIEFGLETFVLCGGGERIATLTGDEIPGTFSFVDDHKIMLDVSGNTRTWDMAQNWRSIGRKGEYDKRVIWRMLGQHRSFTPRIAISAPVKRAVFACYADIEPCNS